MLAACRLTSRLACLSLALALAACSKPPSRLEQILAVGELRVATTNDATTYYLDADGQAGFEYELAKGLADTLGLKLTIIVPPRFSGVLPLVASGRAHIGAAGLTVTPERSSRFAFGPTYLVITEQLVYRRGQVRPDDIEELAGGELHVVAGSSYAERLAGLQAQYPALDWTARETASVEELAEAVWNEAIDYTIVDSHRLKRLRRVFPELSIAFDIGGPQPIAWAMRRDEDDSLSAIVDNYFARLRESGQLARLLDKHFGRAQSFDYVDARVFLRHRENRLPTFVEQFQAAGETTGIDWRLLAALSYQESHWRPKARSPTGVRGIMMLTQTTAKRMGVTNRLDPAQSISGGSRYLREMLDRLPARIDEPDRTWLALAAYNIGLGHLEDARVLTEIRGGNPDSWIDVRETLPLLAQREWHRQTRYGYARGNEPVQFVRNIRRYYDVLSRDRQTLPTGRAEEQARRSIEPSPVL